MNPYPLECESTAPSFVYQSEATSSDIAIIVQHRGNDRGVIPGDYCAEPTAVSPYQKLFEQIHALEYPKSDCDLEGLEPPSRSAQLAAYGIVAESMAYSVLPDRVVAFADGVGIYVRKGTDHYVMVECYNDGDIVVIFSGDNVDGFVREYGYDEIDDLLKTVEAYPR